MIQPSGNPPEIIEGKDAIAEAIGVSKRKLDKLLDLPGGEGPPVRHGHRGYYAFRSRLQDWVDSQDMSARVHRKLARAERIGRAAPCE